MGNLLKEVLKNLCGSNQWSYAVFWKIGCQNPKLLIWEECHYEPSKSSLPTRILRAESPEIPFGEWEKLLMPSESCSSQLGSQAGDRVSALISKMMISNQVNILGEGIVGRAAFTGNHQWILSNSHTTYAHPPEVLNEMQHQFSAGMQTVAVIPVFPHGVVQLGSSLDILENIGFVNDVRRLILQLGCIPGALLSDNYPREDSIEKFGVPVTAGQLTPMDSSGMLKKENSSAYMEDSYNIRSNSSQASSLVGKLSHSLAKEIQNTQETSSLSYDSYAMNTLAKAHGNPRQTNSSSLIKRNSPFGGQLKDGVVRTEVISPSASAWSGLNNNACRFSQSGSTEGSQLSMEHKIFSGSNICNQPVDYRIVTNNLRTSQPRTSGSLLLDRNLSSVSTPLHEGRQINGGLNSNSWQDSVPCPLSNPHIAADAFLSGAPLVGIDLQKAEPSKTEVASSSMLDQSIFGRMLSKSFDNVQCSKDVKTQNGLAMSEQIMDNELFQTLNIPFFDTNEHIKLSDHIPDFAGRDCRNFDKKTPCSGSTNANMENQCARPSSGDDLFDIFGIEFKNKFLSSNQLDENMLDVHENTSTLSGMKGLDSNLYSEREGISDNSLFSGMGTDHLLDAVVSKAHFGPKQSSEDNVSCGTTLTKISTSSAPSSSPAFGRVTLPNHIGGEKFQFPDPPNKAAMARSSSFKSACSRDDTGNCSQTTTVYGSQISSWVEQGNCVKRDNSVSTAYSKRPEEIGKSNRKRLKPGENPRPRPKDRQMIQDRVKELREIVPNGAKCSIDALLERTIKHMLFLQSVTKHADKLKQTGESKIINKEGGLLLKDNFEGGATWAFEVGSQAMVCPIIVEDLSTPRQMLVEMLCEERGFFLEIADLIRGMGLTILKGVMESRNDKIWARFAIEANRDVTRMEIFMSLVHLLEQTIKGGGASSSANAVESNTLTVHDSFAQAAPITATGRSGSLQ